MYQFLTLKTNVITLRDRPHIYSLSTFNIDGIK